MADMSVGQLPSVAYAEVYQQDAAEEMDDAHAPVVATVASSSSVARPPKKVNKEGNAGSSKKKKLVATAGRKPAGKGLPIDKKKQIKRAVEISYDADGNPIAASPAKKKKVHHHHHHAHASPSSHGIVAGIPVNAADAAAIAGASPSANAASAVPTSTPLSPAILSLLADPVWTPQFLQLISSHLLQSRTARINWHVISNSWRQKLMDGGWNKDMHFVHKVDANSTNPRTQVYLVRSRRIASEFTPAVCEKLWTLLAYERDATEEAAQELQQAYEAHQRLEKLAQKWPVVAGAKVTHSQAASGLGQKVKVEFVGGLPVGSQAVAIERGGHANPFDETEMDALESGLDYWSGLTCTTNPELRMDGATMNRWSRGHHAHVQPLGTQIEIGGANALETAFEVASEKSSKNNAQSLGSNSVKLNLMSALTDLCTKFFNEMSDFKGLPFHVQSGEFLPQNQVMTHPHIQMQTLQAKWSSPSDDKNLLDAIHEWVREQSLPKPIDFEYAYQTAALLPHTNEHWCSVRNACSATMFPLGFLRRRWWLLFREAQHIMTQAQQSLFDQIQSGKLAFNDSKSLDLHAEIMTRLPDFVKNKNLEVIVRSVEEISNTVTRRIAAFKEKYGEIPKMKGPKVPPPMQQYFPPPANSAGAAGAAAAPADAVAASAAAPSAADAATTAETTVKAEPDAQVAAQVAVAAPTAEPVAHPSAETPIVPEAAVAVPTQ